MKFFYTTYPLEPHKPEIYIAAHIDIDKKWIIEDFTISWLKIFKIWVSTY